MDRLIKSISIHLDSYFSVGDFHVNYGLILDSSLPSSIPISSTLAQHAIIYLIKNL